MSDVKTALRQARAAMVAEFGLRQRLEKIEWEERVLKPEMERLALEVGANHVVPEISIGDEYSDDD